MKLKIKIWLFAVIWTTHALVFSQDQLSHITPDCSQEYIKKTASNFSVEVEDFQNLLSHTVVNVSANKAKLYSSFPEETTKSWCSGFFVKDAMHVATAAHGIYGTTKAEIIIRNGVKIDVENVSYLDSEHDLVVLKLKDYNVEAIKPNPILPVDKVDVSVNQKIMIVPGCSGTISMNNTSQTFSVGHVDRIDGGNAISSPSFLVNQGANAYAGKSGALVINKNMQALGLLSGSHYSILPGIWSDVSRPQEKQYVQATISSLENLSAMLIEEESSLSFDDIFKNIQQNIDPYGSFHLAFSLVSYPNTYDLITAFVGQALEKAEQDQTAFVFNTVANYSYYYLYNSPGAIDFAKVYYLKANQINADAHTLFHLGMIAHQQGKFKKAKQYINESLAIDPKHAPAQFYKRYHTN